MSQREDSFVNPTPTSKSRPTKASTPKTSDKSLNCSTVSVIPKVDEGKDERLEANRNIRKYGKALASRRKTIVPKRDLFPSEQLENKSMSSRLPSSMSSMSNSMTEERNASIERSIYLRAMLMDVKAKKMLNERNINAYKKVSNIWRNSNELRSKLQGIENEIKRANNCNELIENLKKRKEILENYLNVREVIDPIYHSFAHLIDEQKIHLSIDNMDEKQFIALKNLVESLPQMNANKSFDTISRASENISKFIEMSKNLKELKNEFKKYEEKYCSLNAMKEKYKLTEMLLECNNTLD